MNRSQRAQNAPDGSHKAKPGETIARLPYAQRIALRAKLLEHRPACVFLLDVLILDDKAPTLLKSTPKRLLDALATAGEILLRGQLSGSAFSLVLKLLKGAVAPDGGREPIDYVALRLRSRGILDMPRRDAELDTGRRAWRLYASALVTGNVPDDDADRWESFEHDPKGAQ